MSEQTLQDSIDTTAMRLQSMLARAIHAIRKALPPSALAEVFQDADFRTVFAIKTLIINDKDAIAIQHVAYLVRVRNGKFYSFGFQFHFADAYEDVYNSLMRAQLDFAREVDGLHP